MSRIFRSGAFDIEKSVKITYDELPTPITTDTPSQIEELDGLEELSLDENDALTQTVIDENQYNEERLLQKQKEIDDRLKEAEEIVNRAKEEAQSIVSIAHDEAKNILANAQNQAQALYEQKKNEGYHEGFIAHEEEINDLIKQVNQVLLDTTASLLDHDKEYIDSIEEGVRGFAIDVAEKILHKEVDHDPIALSCLTFEVLDAQKKSKHTNIVLSQRAKELANAIEKELEENIKYKDRDISIELRDIPNNSLLVEHDGGVIDASLKTQLDKLREIFEVK